MCPPSVGPCKLHFTRRRRPGPYGKYAKEENQHQHQPSRGKQTTTDVASDTGQEEENQELSCGTRKNLNLERSSFRMVEIVVLIGTPSICKLQFRIDFRHLINP